MARIQDRSFEEKSKLVILRESHRLRPVETAAPANHTGRESPPRPMLSRHVAPALRQLVDGLSDSPAQVMTLLGETIIQNPMTVTLFDDHSIYTGDARNGTYRWFTGPASRSVHPPEEHEESLARVAARPNSCASSRSSPPGSRPDGIGTRLTTAITDFDKVARNLLDTNKQLQGTLSDVQPGLRSFSQRTLTDVGNLIAETRQLVASANRVVTTVERDPMSLLFGDRREGYKPR